MYIVDDVVSIFRALWDSPPLSQMTTVFIFALTVVLWKLLSGPLSSLDASLKRVTIGLRKYERNSGALPETSHLIDALFKNEPNLCHQWQEYLKSIALEQEGSDEFRRATQPAAAFFDFENVVHAVQWRPFKFESFGAVPGVLTGLGLLGTFAGLVTGLPEGSSTGLKEVTTSIGPFLKHMKGAFVASMSGVFCGLIFNIYERVAREKVQSCCKDLCKMIDQIFPRRTEQTVLNEIRNYAEKQLSEFKNLANDIGNEVARGIVGSATASRELPKNHLDALFPAL